MSALPTRKKASEVLFLKTKQRKKQARSHCVAPDTLEVTIKTKTVLAILHPPLPHPARINCVDFNTQQDGSQIFILLLRAYNFCA